MSVNLTDSYIIPKVLSQFKFRWLVYGAVAYYGLKLLNEKGYLPKQANGALDLVDEGIEMAKEKMGLRRSSKVEPVQQNALH